MKQPNGLSSRISSLATAALAAASLLAGCEIEPKPFDPINLQRVERARAHENENPGMRPLPTTFESPFMPPARNPSTRPVFGPASRPSPTTQPMVRLTLQDIIHRTVANNHDVRVTGYDAAINQARVIEAEAQWDWKFFNETQYQRQQNVQPSIQSPTLGTLANGNNIDFKSLGINTGVKTTTSLGTELSLSENIQRFDRTGRPVEGLPNPFWSNELTFQIKQPLLQNFGTEANTARLAIARNTQKGSLLDFRQQVEKQLFETEQTYWQLVQSEQDVKIREDLLARTRRTAQRFKDRVGSLGISYAEVALTNESVELRSVDLIRARAQVADLSSQLKQKMNDPEIPVSSGTLILAGDQPIEQPINFDLEAQVQTGLTYRAELAQQQLKIDSASITVGAARNNRLPSLNFNGSFGIQGDGTTFSSALSSQGRADFLDYSAGIQLEIPLGFREANAIYRRTELQRQQAIEQYRQLIAQISFEVDKANREVQTTWNEMISARRARLAAEEALRLNELKEQNTRDEQWQSYLTTILNLQEQLGSIQRAEVTAIVNYNIAIAALERAKGTLLRYNNVSLQEERPTSDVRIPLVHQQPEFKKPGW